MKDITLDTPDAVSRALILALGVCYHACLENREDYRDQVASTFSRPLRLPKGSTTIFEEIDW